MRLVLSGLVCGLLAMASPVRAAQAAAPVNRAASQQAKVDDAIAREQGKLQKLQGEVGREEGRSRQADDRLKQQDQNIAELQRQLEALKKAPKEGGHP